MRIGVPKEIKNQEYRVGLTPGAITELTHAGHSVLLEAGAGEGIDVGNMEYKAAGADIALNAATVFASSDMIVKVKEPQPNECEMLRPGQILFTYLHLAPDPIQTKLLLASGATAIAYETVTDSAGRLPLLAPMSEVAGRLSVQVAAHYLQKTEGGRGVLLSGVPGVEPANVLVIGAGVAGINAAQLAVGMGARVVVVDKSVQRLREIDQLYHGRIQTISSTRDAIETYSQWADAIIGAALVPGANAPKLITKAMLSKMKRGSVLIDIAIDQGGCFETSHPTTHDNPVFEVDGVIHYCVANMPGAVPRTSAYALHNVTLPYVIALANHGLDALKKDPGFMAGLNVYRGHLTNAAVADAQGREYVDPLTLL
jgi:alanine dehydrogenase